MRATTVLLVLLVLLVLVVLIGQHVRTNSASYKTANCAEGSSTELVAHKSTASAAHERRSKTAITIRRASGCARLSILPLLVALLRRVALIAVALLGRATVMLLLRWVRRLPAVRVVALVVVTVAALVLLWGLIRLVCRSAIWALLLRIGTVSLAVLVMGWLLAVLLAALLAAILRRLSWIVAVALLLAMRAVAAVIIVTTHNRRRRV